MNVSIITHQMSQISTAAKRAFLNGDVPEFNTSSTEFVPLATLIDQGYLTELPQLPEGSADLSWDPAGYGDGTNLGIAPRILKFADANVGTENGIDGFLQVRAAETEHCKALNKVTFGAGSEYVNNIPTIEWTSGTVPFRSTTFNINVGDQQPSVFCARDNAINYIFLIPIIR